jgi:acyl-homoserine-lactone acylase
MKRQRVLFLLAICFGSLFSNLHLQASEEHSAEILWDTYGIPHIFAPDEQAQFHAFGYAQMHNHADLILKLYGRARGRAAEYWGKDYLDSDKWAWTVGMPVYAQGWYQEHSQEYRKLLDAFAKGMNDYAARHPGRIAKDSKVVLPVTPADALAQVLQSIHFTFVANRGMVGQLARMTKMEPAGSNAWAVAPKRTESGNALLLANPHLPWNDLFTWFEAQLVAPGLNASGAALVGTPMLGIGFNDNLGWTHTVNTHDGVDLYELTLEEKGYRWDATIKSFDIETKSILVKQNNGTFQTVKLNIYRSVHGPVIVRNQKKAIAMRVVGLDRPNITQQYRQMMRANNLGEFEKAQSLLQMPMFTTMYADKDGNIMHLFGGQTPVRPQGNYNWRQIVPGDTSKTLWTQYHTYDELPKILNPQSGWLQNANDPPWTTTFPHAIDPDDFPKYMAPRFMDLRPQRSAGMLAADSRISYEEFTAYSLSTRMEAADRVLDELIPAAKESGSAKALEAVKILERWDRCADNESKGAVLFKTFWNQIGGYPLKTSWSPDKALTTPDGLADAEKAVNALVKAYDGTSQLYGKADVAWGEVHRLIMDSVDLPANGGSGGLGIFRATGYGRMQDNRFGAGGGDSYKAVIEFGDPVRAQALLSYGNASQPGSPHRTDQLELYSKKKYRPVWRTRKEIEANLERREIIQVQ